MLNKEIGLRGRIKALDKLERGENLELLKPVEKVG